MGVAEHIFEVFEVSDDLGMVVTWINLERALLEKTFTGVQSKGGKIRQNVVSCGNLLNS